MNREEIDTLWFKAMHESIASGEDFTRYHFAALVAEAEREACAKVCEETRFPDSYTAIRCAAAIRARSKV